MIKTYKLSFLMLSFCVVLFSCQSKKTNSTDTELVTKPKNTVVVKKAPTSTTAVNAGVAKGKETAFVYGIDISKYQGDEIDFLNKKTDSLGFVICKATEGITYTDPDFTHNWNMISEKKFIRGAYHFYRSNDDPIAQAKNYINALATLQKTDFPPIIDFEEGGIDKAQSVAEVQATLLQFINAVEKALKRKVIIYTDVNTGNKYLNKANFASYSLWIANYNNAAQPEVPITWQEDNWVLWQKSASYKIGTTLNDFDVYNGNLLDLQQFIATTTHP